MAYSIYLKEQIERAGLADQVTFIGEVSDMEPFYALADAFFLSSRLDPLPNVSIDAAMRGIPIVCFAAASGIAEILIKDPLTAHGVVPHLDAEAASQFIARIAEDANEAAEIAAATQHLAKNTFDMVRYVAQLDKLGQQAMAIEADASGHAE
jgi:glycosyltransferase involved in cell wall biosynthesis